jgi:NodT family efflux transporter outer membrane factor (OMF) lipoprotein
LLLVITGCRQRLKLTTGNIGSVMPARALPERYQLSADSSNESIATINWRAYFKDSLLIELIDTALKNNYDLKLALQRLAIGNSQLLAARANRQPSGGIGLGSSLRKFGLYTMDGAGNIVTEITPGKIVPIHLADFFPNAYAGWEIDLWGRLQDQKQSAYQQFLATEEANRLIVTNVIAEIAKGYYQLLSLDEKATIIQKSIQTGEEILEVIKIQKEAAKANELAVQQFKAQLLDFIIMQQEIKQEVIETENYLNYLLGRYPEIINRNAAAFKISELQLPSTGTPAALLSNRPDIREAEKQLLAARFELQAARKSFYPSLNISLSLGLQAFNPAYLLKLPASLAYSLVSGLVAPLFNPQRLRAQLQAATAVQMQALLHYQQVIIRAFSEVSTALAMMQNLRQILNTRQEQSATLSQSVEIANDLYKYGKANYLEVLFARQRALEAELEVVESIKKMHLANVEMYRVLGGGWQN